MFPQIVSHSMTFQGNHQLGSAKFTKIVVPYSTFYLQTVEIN